MSLSAIQVASYHIADKLIMPDLDNSSVLVRYISCNPLAFYFNLLSSPTLVYEG